MKRIAVIAASVLVLFGAAGCPQKPNPFCPNNVCGKAPKHHEAITTPMPVPTPTMTMTTTVEVPINVPETTSPTATYDHKPPDW